MSTTITSLTGIEDSTTAVEESSNVGPSLETAGASFGELIKGVGLAAAETQLKLTENSAATTSKLASTLVDVIAVQETQIDDLGNITGSKTHVQRLPLLNFVDPAFYSYPQIKIEGHFVMSSFATDTNTNVDTSSSSFGAGFSFSRTPGLFGGTSIGGGARATSSSSSSNLATQTSQATAVGRMRMCAQLAPQAGLGVPNPVQVVIGPSLSILEQQITEAEDADHNLTRTMAILIQYRDKDGKPIKGKALSIETDGVLWNFTDDAKNVTGDTAPNEGNLSIQLKRIFPAPTDPQAPPVDKSPRPATLNVRKGLVTNGITVTF
ncbi:MAG: hypothetical protein QOE82_2484 [Thermoanaerobaculia bacterium]|nr:hypothetical protein [Thermoanaerobaculia bacterium]